MKFLLDANLSPALKGPLSEAGHETLHVADLGLLHASDDDIFQRADDDGYTVITADSDFPTMLALRRATTPSVVHTRKTRTCLTVRESGASTGRSRPVRR